jgi:8-oxo-dGTP pyrophosphatase MutT (NUDIX family)
MNRRIAEIGLRLASLGRGFVMRVVPLRLRAVKAIITSPDGQVLLVRHSYGTGDWMFPGGHVRRSEPFDVAVAREMHEELGVSPEKWSLVAEFAPRTGLTRQRLGMYTAVVDPDRITPNHEIADVRFVDPAQPPADISPATARRLAEYAAGTMAGGAW